MAKSVFTTIESNPNEYYGFEGSVVRETEKAVLVEANVTWTYNKNHKRQIWFPKSAVRVVRNGLMEAKDWVLCAKMRENEFNGRPMYFCNCDVVLGI